MAPSEGRGESTYPATGRIAASVVFALFASLTLFGLIHHEPWGDEANVWLLAQDITVAELFYHAGYTGHPVLWPLLLMPFAKLGFPYISMQLIHWVISCCAAGLFLFRAPFPILTKVLILSSVHMIFEYSVVARNYSLAMLFLFGCAALHRRRFEAPLLYGAILGLLYNTHVLVFGGAAALSILFAWECAQQRPIKPALLAGLAMIGIGALSAFLQMVPTRPDAYPGGAGLFPIFEPSACVDAVLDGIFALGYWSKIVPESLKPILSGQIFAFILLALALSTAAGLWKTVITSRTSRCFLLMSVVWLFYLFTFKYHSTFRHHGWLWASVIVASWLGAITQSGVASEISLRRWVLVCLNLCLFASLVPGIDWYRKDYRHSFSPSKESARYLLESGYSRYRLVAMNHSFLPYLREQLPKKKVWAILQHGYGSYHLFDNNHYARRRELDLEKRVAQAIAAMPDRQDTLLLLRWKLQQPEAFRAKPLWSTSALQGKLWLYELEP